MNTPGTKQLAAQAEQLYEQQLKQELEPTHFDKFVAIEPISGNYYLGASFGEAIRAARQAHPDRLSHVMRIGRKTALHL